MKRTQRLFMFMLLGVLVASLSLPALALDLQAARTAGLVAEKQDGFVKALSAQPEAVKVADEVNARRLAEYQKISRENGQAVDVVARLAAKEIIERLTPGALYMAPDGSLKKR